MNYFTLVALWLLYFFLHSLLAALWVKAFFEGILGKAFRFYRIIYSLISTIGLFFLLFINSAIPSWLLFESIGLVRYLSLMFATFGVIVIARTFKEYRFSSFIGLEEEGNAFKRTGILRYVRHPIYSGTILIVIGFFSF
jgi:methanethiol S-methyltransferase